MELTGSRDYNRRSLEKGIHMRFLFPATLFAILALPTMDTNAQSFDQQLAWCNGQGNASTDPDLVIKGCTGVIQSGKLVTQTQNLALVFNKRATAYGRKGQNDLALKDYDQTLRLTPNYAEGFFNRGYTYFLLGQNDRAVQDYDQAIRFKPDFALAFEYRGELKLKKGDTVGGNADIARAKFWRLNPR